MNLPATGTQRYRVPPHFSLRSEGTRGQSSLGSSLSGLVVSDLTGGCNVLQEKFERLHVALPTSAGIPFITRMELPPRQSGHRISNRISNKPETMNTDTPRTNEALAAILDKDGYLSEDNAPDVLVKLSRTMERERDELRAQLREEQQLHVQTLNERDEARQWESQALVARIQRDEFSKTLGEIREMLCEAMPNENAPTSFMAATLVKERDEAQKQLLNLWKL